MPCVLVLLSPDSLTAKTTVCVCVSGANETMDSDSSVCIVTSLVPKLLVGGDREPGYEAT